MLCKVPSLTYIFTSSNKAKNKIDIIMKKKLERSKSKKMIGGVSAGLAEYLDIDVTIIRVLFIVAFFAPIPSIIPYIAFWIAMPLKQEFQNMEMN